jgi:hypothetical protein
VAPWASPTGPSGRLDELVRSCWPRVARADDDGGPMEGDAPCSRVSSCRSISASTPIERCPWRSRSRGARRATRCRERDLAWDRPGVRHGKGPGSCPPDGRRRRDHRAGEPAPRARGAWPHRGRAPGARSGQPRRGPELTSSGAGRAGARCPLTTTAASHQAGHRSDQAPAVGQVIEASKMLAIESCSAASNSSTLCWIVSPSVSAREKLAVTPWLRASRELASWRV